MTKGQSGGAAPLFDMESPYTVVNEKKNPPCRVNVWEKPPYLEVLTRRLYPRVHIRKGLVHRDIMICEQEDPFSVASAKEEK